MSYALSVDDRRTRPEIAKELQHGVTVSHRQPQIKQHQIPDRAFEVANRRAAVMDHIDGVPAAAQTVLQTLGQWRIVFHCKNAQATSTGKLAERLGAYCAHHAHKRSFSTFLNRHRPADRDAAGVRG